MAEQPTKKCPYCGERIHLEAIKCRFCREFLEDEKGLPISYHARRNQAAAPAHPLTRQQDEDQTDDDGEDDLVLYSDSPSLWGLASHFIIAFLLFLIAGFLLFYPIGNLLEQASPKAAQWSDTVDHVTDLIGIGMVLITVGWLIYHIAELKSIAYEVTHDRIEFSRGVFSRKIDNLDMFRVVDMKLHRSLLDCLTGVGSVTLVTKDETDPYFEFEKVYDPKALYDVIKVASLKADRKQGVVHLD